MLQRNLPEEVKARRKSEYKEWKRRVRRLIEESKRRVDEEFGRKLSQNFSENKKLFWKEVKKVRGGERSGDVRMRGENGELVRSDSELKGSRLRWYGHVRRREEDHILRRAAAMEVTMYVCGPTVYNLAHIGNARPVVVFDTLYRLLQTGFAEVVYARNITDIDDKIIAAARDTGQSINAVTDEFTAKYREDMAHLNALSPSLEPHATENIGPMIALTEALIAKGHAYESQGHVLFAVESMADYGRLSKRSLDDMLAGARVEVADYKRHPGDFVLWKPAADDDPGWDSP